MQALRELVVVLGAPGREPLEAEHGGGGARQLVEEEVEPRVCGILRAEVAVVVDDAQGESRAKGTLLARQVVIYAAGALDVGGGGIGDGGRGFHRQ